MKLCKDCNFIDGTVCQEAESHNNLLDGGKLSPTASAWEMRLSEGFCGAGAKRFKQKQPKLKECPFCGMNSHDLVGPQASNDGEWWIECQACEITMERHTKGLVIQDWNRREG